MSQECKTLGLKLWFLVIITLIMFPHLDSAVLSLGTQLSLLVFLVSMKLVSATVPPGGHIVFFFFETGSYEWRLAFD